MTYTLRAMPATWLTWQGLAAGRASRRTPSNLVKGRPRAVGCPSKATKEPSPAPPLRDASAAPQTDLVYLHLGAGSLAGIFGQSGLPIRLAKVQPSRAPRRAACRKECPGRTESERTALPAGGGARPTSAARFRCPGVAPAVRPRRGFLRRSHGPLRRRHEREAGAPEPLPAPALEHHGALAPESAERDAGQRVVYLISVGAVDALES